MTEVVIRETKVLKGEVCAPPSKAYTQRMLIASALSQGTSKISNPLISEDTQATMDAVKILGAEIETLDSCWVVKGNMPLSGSKKPIDCGESGATLRFVIPVAALATKPSKFVLGSGLARRPIEPLLESLRQLGTETAVQKKRNGKMSIQVKGGGIRGGKASMPGDVSSQFVSGLMFACPLAKTDTKLTITSPLESKNYVLITERILERHGVKVEIAEDFSRVNIPGNQTYKPVDGRVPGDFSSAAFLLSAAAITDSDVVVKNLDHKKVQGDKAILQILQQMGVEGKVCEDSVEIEGKHELLRAVETDARDIPDLVPICAALACFAEGTSRICNAERLRLKESDRLSSLYSELTKMGAEMTMDQSSLTIKGPCRLHGASIDPHNDHRIAMACSVAALGATGETVIQDAECVRKSYPDFFIDLRKIGAEVVGGEFDR
ncbi:MAG: 3-phosphoshikimate 1-carboxyvinyltransferase [Methanoregula sp.]|nr:3-phosphoshikimate 1-carboxyvinyltransferase [Methanoregula sp.]